MNQDKKPYRINGQDVVVKAENALYTNNGMAGVADAKGALDNLDSRLQTVEGGGGGTSSEKNTRMVHFSFDDAIVALRYISNNASSYDSIFQHPEMARLKKWHDDYGAVFSMYTFLQQLNPNNTSEVWFDLSNITNKFAEEFTANADWLRFGLHCRNNMVNYGSGDGIDAAGVTSDYNTFVTQIVRITGSVKCIDMVPRLHNYAGTLANVQAMRNCECGIIGLLGSDDTSGGLGTGGYYLGSGTAAQALLRNKGRYYDATEQLHFFPTNTRLESVAAANIQSFIEGFGQPAKWSRAHDVILFTHEPNFAGNNGTTLDSTMESKIETCLAWAYNNGFSFGFPMDKILG